MEQKREVTELDFDLVKEEVVISNDYFGIGVGKSGGFSRVKVCSICYGPYLDYGHNAQPVNNGRCCTRCNQEVVLRARVNRMDKGLSAYDAPLDQERIEGIKQAILENKYNPPSELPQSSS